MATEPASTDPLRDALVAGLRTRVRRFKETGDQRFVLAAEAEHESTALLGRLTTPVTDIEAITAVGLLHWERAVLMGRGQGGADLERAVVLLRLVHETRPGDVPPALAATLRELADGTDLRFRPVFAEGKELLDRGMAGGDPAVLAAAVAKLTEAASLVPADHAERPELLNRLGVALRNVFERTGDRASLDLAIARLREAIQALPPGSPLEAMYTSNLGAAFYNRHSVSRRPEDVAEAVRLCRAAVRATPSGHPEYAKRLSNLGGALLSRHDGSGDPAVLDEAVDVMQRAVDATVPSDGNRWRHVVNLSTALADRGRREGSVADFDRAIDGLESVVRALPPGSPFHFAVLHNLGSSLYDRYALTRGPLDLDAAVEAARGALRHTAAPHPQRALAEGHLGRMLGARFDRTGNTDDLDAAVTALRSALDTLPAGDSTRPSFQAALGAALLALARLHGRASDLDAAEAYLERALAGIPPGGPEQEQLGGMLAKARERKADLAGEEGAAAEEFGGAQGPDPEASSDLGVSLARRYDRTGEPAVLDEAIAAMRAAVDATPPGDRLRANRRHNLAALLLRRHARTAEAADLDAAAEAALAAVRAVGSGSDAEGDAAADAAQVRAYWLDTVTECRQRRFQATQAAADLDAWVAAAAAVTRTAPADDPGRPAYFGRLGKALAERHFRGGAPTDLDASIEACRTAGDTGTADNLLVLSGSLLTRYQHGGDEADLAEAVRTGRAAADRIPVGAAHRAAALATYGNILRTRFERTGRPEDLDASLRACRDAVQALPDADPLWPSVLCGLANALGRRYELTGALGDLDEAVEATREAIRRGPGHVDLPLLHSNLAASLVRRHEGGRRRPGDLDEAVENARTAVELPHARYRDEQFWSVLGTALSRRHGRTGSHADLDAAVAAHRTALEATPPGSPGRILNLDNLADALERRYLSRAEPADLDAALAGRREAAAAVPPGAPLRGQVLYHLGCCLLRRFNAAQDDAVYDEALAALREAARTTSVTPGNRILAARQLGLAFAGRGRWEDACDAYASAVELLPTLAARSRDRLSQEHWLASVAGIGSDAAACALFAGDPERALRLWEAGRGTLLAQALETRTDVAELAAHHPDLAARFERLRQELDARGAEPPWQAVTGTLAGTGTGTGTPGAGAAPGGAPPEAGPGAALSTGLAQRTAERRRQTAAEFDALVGAVRGLPGFESFLLPPEAAELRAHALEGPVVALNVSGYRCDALVVLPDRIEAVPLPGLSEEAVGARAADFAAALAAGRDPRRGVRDRLAAQQTVTAVLAWLWDAVTGPVLDALGIVAAPGPGRPWPRVWWAPSGQLTALPLHAAGHHEDTGPGARAVIERAVSSYTPTIRALAHSRARTRPAARTEDRASRRTGTRGKALVVSMPETPDAAPLPATVRERQMLVGRFPYPLVLTGAQATAARVLAELPHHPVAHFACHAAHDPSDPSAGRLLLHDHREHPLTVRDIARLHLDAELAFLSACDTSRAGPRLPDEAIHLTSSFQIAGFAQVIGTLWPVDDEAAADIAADVYAHLTPGPGSEPDTARTALALHAAVRRVRQRHPRTPTRWAAHLHAGA